MALIHQTDEYHIVNTVSKFRVKFYGKTKNFADPKNPIIIKADLWMVSGTGKGGYHSKSIYSKVEYSCVYDAINKTLTKDGAVIEMSNKEAVMLALDQAVREALTEKEFGNNVY